MTQTFIKSRLYNQGLATPRFSDVQEVVAYMGAFQAQDWNKCTWALGLRLAKLNYQDILEAFNRGELIRTHILRPTWHFVAPLDLRWMLSVSAPRVKAWNAFMYRKCELSEREFKQAQEIMVKCLSNRNFQTRDQIRVELEKAGITGDTIRMSCIFMEAELEGVICSGPRIGNQYSYALIDEVIPATTVMTSEEALRELTLRYFRARTPAQLPDFAWWSGLTQAQCKKGIQLLGKEIETIEFDGKTWYSMPGPLPEGKINDTFLMPDYDEYGIGFKDRSLYDHPDRLKGNGFISALVVEGCQRGTWFRSGTGKKINIDVKVPASLNKTQLDKVQKAIAHYERFFGNVVTTFAQV